MYMENKMSHSDLSEDQYDAYQRCMKGQNVFITGPGGCGKSYLIHKLVKMFHEETSKRVQVCAMTGTASILLDCNAKTLHSWSGIGQGKGDHHHIITNIALNKFKRKAWKKTDVLILDEVSMLSKNLFELLDAIGKRIRTNGMPFGGIQLIFSGDFLQLPPVPNHGDPDSALFSFQSPLWKDTFDAQILLDKVFRQKNPLYIELLHEVREGTLSKKNMKLLESRKVRPQEDITMLVARRNEADQINNWNLTKLKGEKQQFKCSCVYQKELETLRRPSPKEIDSEFKYLKKNARFDEVLELKIGARVMCIVNLDMENGLCNGSTGYVIGFNHEKHPVVAFDNEIKRVIKPHPWKSDKFEHVSIEAVPLILAWAITIHKSQGATLDKACMDLGSDVFAEGQMYVALSRVKSLDGIYLTSFNPRRIRANKEAIEFYNQFYDEEEEVADEVAVVVAAGAAIAGDGSEGMTINEIAQEINKTNADKGEDLTYLDDVLW